MNKGVIGIVIAIIIIAVAVAGFAVYRNGNKNNTEENLVNNEQEENLDNEENTSVSNTENTTKSGSKTLVVYYSAQNHTKTIAEKIAKNLNADTFEIVPEEIYTNDDLNWNNSNSRVSKEHDNESLRDVKLKNAKVSNWEEAENYFKKKLIREIGKMDIDLVQEHQIQIYKNGQIV